MVPEAEPAGGITNQSREDINMSMLTVYFFVMMDNLTTGAMVFAFASVTGIIALALARSDHNPEQLVYRRYSRWMSILTVTMCLFGILTVFTPNTKQFAAIYLIPKVVNNEDVRAMSGDAMKAMRLKFREWLDSLEPQKVVKETVKAIGSE